jgi:acyl-CoA synthetase (AMP-forming)/AMP-acid ligase II
MFIGADYDIETDVIVRLLPLFHDMGMTGFLTVPMYFGAELVKITRWTSGATPFCGPGSSTSTRAR